MVRMVLGFVIHIRHIISFEQQCGRHAELSVKIVLMTIFHMDMS